MIENLNFYEPHKIVITEHDGIRWFSDSRLLVPLRCSDTPKSVLGCWDFDGEDYVASVGDMTEIVAKLLQATTERNYDRRGAALAAWPIDDVRMVVYLQVGSATMNRLIIDTAEYIAQRKVDGFGVATEVTHSVTLYSGAEVVGLLMPIRMNVLTNLITLGVEL